MTSRAVAVSLGVVALVVLVACGHGRPRLGVRTDELLAHAAALGRDGQASLEIVREHGGTRRPIERRNVTLDQQVRFAGTTTTLILLLRGCPPFAGTQPCPLVPGKLVYLTQSKLTKLGANAREEVVRDDPPVDEFSEARIVVGTLSLASFAGMGLCIAFCESSTTAKSVALGGGGVVLGFIWLLMSGEIRD